MTDGLIRAANPADVPEILQLITELAEYERAVDSVVATPEMLARALFSGTDTPSGVPAVWCKVVEHADPGPDGRRLGGMVLWFLNYSTWTGTHGAYIEDLFVRPMHRGQGYGQRLLAAVAAECVDRGYARLDWSVLDWNTPAIDFYYRQGAEPQSEWTTFRLTGPPLATTAATAK